MSIEEIRRLFFDSTVELIEMLNHQYNLYEHLQEYSMYHHESPHNGFTDGYLFGLDTAMSSIRHHQEYMLSLFNDLGVIEDSEGGAENV